VTKRATTWIGFLRGVNVGGKTTVPMKALVQRLEEAGLENVRTYIQSGNVVFESSVKDAHALERRICKAIEGRFKIEPAVQVLSAQSLAQAAAANPFPHAEPDHKSLHLFFLAEAPKAPDLDGLQRLRIPSEAFALVGRVFYLHAPDGIARSKLAAAIGKRLGVEVTARNWRTVCKVLEMAEAPG
jgi:uncharacterized protein (DUF1697 family)